MHVSVSSLKFLRLPIDHCHVLSKFGNQVPTLQWCQKWDGGADRPSATRTCRGELLSRLDTIQVGGNGQAIGRGKAVDDFADPATGRLLDYYVELDTDQKESLRTLKTALMMKAGIGQDP